jgi:hypothetical protein
MFKCFSISIFTLAVILSGWIPVSIRLVAASAAPVPFTEQNGSANSVTAPLPDAEIRARAQKLIANQHNDDDALDEYERVERHLDRTGGATPHTLEDKFYRVVPTGSGTLRILLKDGGTPVNPVEYRHELQLWEEVLQLMLNPNDPRTKAANEKFEKRKRDRAEMVDAGNQAFSPKWVGMETRNGRVCYVFQLDPNPDFRPHSLFQNAMTQVSAKVWVDRDSNQMVRGEAHILRDISFGGGILGKLYRGGTFSMDQAEVAPGIWLPTDYQYDFSGRKFLFSFEENQTIEASRYRRVGPPKEALAIVQDDLATGKIFSVDP